MKLPSSLENKTEWVFVGPMGPALPSQFEDHPIVSVDGGAHHARRMDLWVGDADSYRDKIDTPHIYRHPIEKDQSDLALAMELFRENRHYKFHLWGFLGGRKDHELFNLGECLQFLDEHQECQMLFYGHDGRVHYYLVGAGHWKFAHVGLFSLGTLKKTLVRLTGCCRYQITTSRPLAPLSSLGLSNEGSGEMTLETEGPVFIYFPEGE